MLGVAQGTKCLPCRQASKPEAVSSDLAPHLWKAGCGGMYTCNPGSGKAETRGNHESTVSQSSQLA